MKKIIFVLFTLLGSSAWGQNLPGFDNVTYDGVKLDQVSDYRAADTFALRAAQYIMSTPFQKDDQNRLKALQFLSKWMSGTPDYSFTLDQVAGKIIKDNDLLGQYMAAMAKFALENKAASKNLKLVKLNAITSLLDYCENEHNHMKMTRQLKKLSEARAKGELEKEL